MSDPDPDAAYHNFHRENHPDFSQRVFANWRIAGFAIISWAITWSWVEFLTGELNTFFKETVGIKRWYRLVTAATITVLALLFLALIAYPLNLHL